MCQRLPHIHGMLLTRKIHALNKQVRKTCMKQRKCREYKGTSKISQSISLENLFLYNSGGIKDLTTKDTLLASGQSKFNKGRILKRSQ